jgi:hypothetical protein
MKGKKREERVFLWVHKGNDVFFFKKKEDKKKKKKMKT